jgi:prepilin-type N-terminal cleavage/methylation domain-containing protein
MFGHRRKLGFSMVELMIALAICAFGIAAAAKISSSAVRSSRRGSETVDLGQRARLVSRQLRVDLRLAGVGSTGAIGVDNGQAPWSTIDTGYGSTPHAIPAVTGANNIGASTTLPGGVKTPPWLTDAIQIVVPDPTTRQTTSEAVAAGASLIPLLATVPAIAFPTCPNRLVYISDHAAANAAGRTQISAQGGACTGCVNIVGTTQFNMAPGADVMCARISTYFVGQPAGSQIYWLMRSDLDPAQGQTAVNGAQGTVYVNTTPNMTTLLHSPGVYDLQVAYAFSSEFAGRAAAPAGRWAFASTPGVDPTATMTNWFEAREVRFNMLVTNVRELTESGQPIPELASEDGAVIQIPIERSRFRLTAGESLVSLRLFDKAMTAGIVATPY